MPIPAEILKKALEIAKRGSSIEERESFERSCRDLMEYAVSHPLANSAKRREKPPENDAELMDITEDSGK